MRVGSSVLALPVLALVLPAGMSAEKSPFDEVVLVEGKPPRISLLYVVLTDPEAETHRKLDDLVLKHAAAALREAAMHKFKGTTEGDDRPRYDGNIVFLVRATREQRQGVATGFSVEQLRAIAAAEPERARKLVTVHAWSPGELPEKK